MLLHRIASFFRQLRKSVASESRLGIAWYREDQWSLLHTVSVDADNLEKTYAEWLSFAQTRYDELVKKGTRVEKVDVDVQDMASWCRELGRKVDGTGRTAYVVYMLQKQKRAAFTKNLQEERNRKAWIKER